MPTTLDVCAGRSTAVYIYLNEEKEVLKKKKTYKT